MTATKRICVQHTTGPLTGIYQTVGLSHPEDLNFPSHLTNVWFNGREINAVLVRAEARYVLYREEALELIRSE